MQMRSGSENSVCPSVCLSVCLSVRPFVRLTVKRVICDKMEERAVQIFISYEKLFSLVFCEEEWLVGTALCVCVCILCLHVFLLITRVRCC